MMPPAQIETPHFSWRTVVVILAPVVCLAPFINKAFHMDDPVYLWVAQHIQQHPIDFYGFEKNWSFFDEPMHEINKNPPGVSYFIAGAASVFGWLERALHAVFLLPLLGLSVSTYWLAARLTRRPHVATLIALLSPAVLVSSSNVMSDTLTLALFTASVALWVHGLDRSRHAWLFGAAALMACAILTKYIAVCVLPLLFAYTLARKRALGLWTLHFLVPILALGGYQVLSQRLYGMNLLGSAVEFSATHKIDPNASPAPLGVRTLIGLAFMGGCHAGALFVMPLLWTRKSLAILVFAPAAVVGLLFLISDGLNTHLMNPAYSLTPSVKLQMTLFIIAGAHLFAMAARDYALHRTPESLLLVLWVTGIFVFSTYLNWTVNARTMLPMAPAVGILAGRRLDWSTITPPNWALAAAITAAASLALAVTWADYRLANAARTAAERFANRMRAPDETHWIQGNWGARWYFEAAGAKPFDARAPVVMVNDVVIQSWNNLIYPLPDELTDAIHADAIPVAPWISTMDRRLGAGFYTHAWGPLPFAFGRTYPERYTYLRLTPP